MKDTLRNKCDLFVDNYTALSKKFKWNHAINSRLGALLYTMENRRVDEEAILRCRNVIKENTGVFSQFKDTTNFMTSVMLALHAEPEAMLKGAINVYDSMKKEGFHSSPYLVIAAITIALQSDPYNYHRIIISAKNYYDTMKDEHKFITSADDYGFAALLAMTDKSVAQAVREMENCYRILKGDFFNSNTVQTLSQVLTFSEEEAYAKCKRVADLHKALKERKAQIGSGIELSFLGVLALLQRNTDLLADEIVETKEYLKSKKGFGTWSISSTERIMFAVALVCDDHLMDTKKSPLELAVANNITGILLAQQMVTMAAATGAAVAASSS